MILPSHLRDLSVSTSTSKWALIATSLTKLFNLPSILTGLFLSAVWAGATTTMVFFSLFLISLGLFTSGWVKFFFSPQVESEEVYINVRLPPGTP